MSEVRADRAARPTRRGLAAVLLALLGPQVTLLLLRTEPSLDLILRSATATPPRPRRATSSTWP